jgi:hypothetical protein
VIVGVGDVVEVDRDGDGDDRTATWTSGAASCNDDATSEPTRM